MNRTVPVAMVIISLIVCCVLSGSPPAARLFQSSGMGGTVSGYPVYYGGSLYYSVSDVYSGGCSGSSSYYEAIVAVSASTGALSVIASSCVSSSSSSTYYTYRTPLLVDSVSYWVTKYVNVVAYDLSQPPPAARLFQSSGMGGTVSGYPVYYGGSLYYSVSDVYSGGCSGSSSYYEAIVAVSASTGALSVIASSCVSSSSSSSTYYTYRTPLLVDSVSYWVTKYGSVVAYEQPPSDFCAASAPQQLLALTALGPQVPIRISSQSQSSVASVYFLCAALNCVTQVDVTATSSGLLASTKGLPFASSPSGTLLNNVLYMPIAGWVGIMAVGGSYFNASIRGTLQHGIPLGCAIAYACREQRSVYVFSACVVQLALVGNSSLPSGQRFADGAPLAYAGVAYYGTKSIWWQSPATLVAVSGSTGATVSVIQGLSDEHDFSYGALWGFVAYYVCNSARRIVKFDLSMNVRVAAVNLTSLQPNVLVASVVQSSQMSPVIFWTTDDQHVIRLTCISSSFGVVTIRSAFRNFTFTADVAFSAIGDTLFYQDGSNAVVSANVPANENTPVTVGCFSNDALMFRADAVIYSSPQLTAAGFIIMAASTGVWQVNVAQLCYPGSYRVFNMTTGFTVCTPCTTGSYSTDRMVPSCTLCPSGTYNSRTSMSSATACVACPPGTYTSTPGTSICVPCPPLQYNPLSNQTSCMVCESPSADRTRCAVCPAGSFRTAAGTCELCAAGTFGNVSGLTSCLPCPAGSFSAGEGLTSCQLCPMGSYSSSIRSTVCSLCVPGTFSNVSGAVSAASCLPCAAGSYNSYAGMSSCTLCPTGTFSAQSGQSIPTTCAPCATGSYSDTEGRVACTLCPGGSANALSGQWAATACILCADGAVAPMGSSSCNLCPAGYFAESTGQTSCTRCPNNTYSSTAGAAACQPCVQPNSQATACLVCPAGSYGDGTACTACPAGTFLNAIGATAASSCQSCAPGTFSAASGQTSASACQPCDVGMYGPSSGLTSCVTCPGGTYSDLSGQSSISACHECPAGSFSSLGSSVCTLCPAGTYNALLKQVSCTPCAAGTYNTNAGGSSSSACVTCPSGTYNPLTGQTSCLPCLQTTNGGANCSLCPTGTYLSQAACLQCPAGTYGPYSAQTTVSSCLKCAVGSYSAVAGSTSCIQCPAGATTNGPGSSSLAQCTSAVSCGYGRAYNATTLSCVVCPAGTYGADVSASTCTSCPAGTASSSAGATSTASCVACGVGWYSAAAGSTNCSACSAGTYGTVSQAISAALCTPCAPGTASASSGAAYASSCTACQGGYYSSAGAAACEPCAAGTFCTSGGTSAASCIACPAGTFTSGNGSSSCNSCLPGSFNVHAGAISVLNCTLCAAGTYSGVSGASSAAVCTPCPAGTYGNRSGANSVASGCFSCRKGRWSRPGSQVCVTVSASFSSSARSLSRGAFTLSQTKTWSLSLPTSWSTTTTRSMSATLSDTHLDVTPTNLFHTHAPTFSGAVMFLPFNVSLLGGFDVAPHTSYPSSVLTVLADSSAKPAVQVTLTATTLAGAGALLAFPTPLLSYGSVLHSNSDSSTLTLNTVNMTEAVDFVRHLAVTLSPDVASSNLSLLVPLNVSVQVTDGASLTTASQWIFALGASVRVNSGPQIANGTCGAHVVRGVRFSVSLGHVFSHPLGLPLRVVFSAASGIPSTLQLSCTAVGACSASGVLLDDGVVQFWAAATDSYVMASVVCTVTSVYSVLRVADGVALPLVFSVKAGTAFDVSLPVYTFMSSNGVTLLGTVFSDTHPPLDVTATFIGPNTLRGVCKSVGLVNLSLLSADLFTTTSAALQLNCTDRAPTVVGRWAPVALLAGASFSVTRFVSDAVVDPDGDIVSCELVAGSAPVWVSLSTVSPGTLLIAGVAAGADAGGFPMGRNISAMLECSDGVLKTRVELVLAGQMDIPPRLVEALPNFTAAANDVSAWSVHVTQYFEDPSGGNVWLDSVVLSDALRGWLTAQVTSSGSVLLSGTATASNVADGLQAVTMVVKNVFGNTTSGVVLIDVSATWWQLVMLYSAWVYSAIGVVSLVLSAWLFLVPAVNIMTCPWRQVACPLLVASGSGGPTIKEAIRTSSSEDDGLHALDLDDILGLESWTQDNTAALEGESECALAVSTRIQLQCPVHAKCIAVICLTPARDGVGTAWTRVASVASCISSYLSMHLRSTNQGLPAWLEFHGNGLLCFTTEKGDMHTPRVVMEEVDDLGIVRRVYECVYADLVEAAARCHCSAIADTLVPMNLTSQSKSSVGANMLTSIAESERRITSQIAEVLNEMRKTHQTTSSATASGSGHLLAHRPLHPTAVTANDDWDTLFAPDNEHPNPLEQMDDLLRKKGDV